MKIVDLSRELYHRTPTYPGHSAIIHGMWKTHEESFVDGGNVHGLASMYFAMPDHGGTHFEQHGRGNCDHVRNESNGRAGAAAP